MIRVGKPAADEHARLLRRVKLLSWIGLPWLLADGAIGMTAGLAANSVALIGWGIDCAIQSAAKSPHHLALHGRPCALSGRGTPLSEDPSGSPSSSWLRTSSSPRSTIS